jgi:hypothetical protein
MTKYDETIDKIIAWGRHDSNIEGAIIIGSQVREEIQADLSKLAGAQGRKDEEPNKELAKELVEKRDIEGIRKVAQNLRHEDKRVQTDCLSVLEQIGLLEPEMIQDYVDEFIELVFGKNNRLVWAAMINLALIADKKPREIFERYDEIVKVIEKGSVITKDNGIKTLAKVAATSTEYGKVITPYLMEQLRSCRSKSVPQYAESIRVAVPPDYREEYLGILNKRLDALSVAQQKRVKKLLKTGSPGLGVDGTSESRTCSGPSRHTPNKLGSPTP